MGIKPPKGLSKAARTWWARLTSEYSIADPQGLLLLEMALRAFDRAEQARAVLDREGVTSVDTQGRPKMHPAAAVERDSRQGFLSALRQLHLDCDPLKPHSGRPAGGG